MFGQGGMWQIIAGSVILVILLFFGVDYVRPYIMAPENNIQDQKSGSQQHFNGQPYTDTERITICHANTSDCSTAQAMINHTGPDGASIEEVKFDSGAVLYFGSASLPGSGTDQNGAAWSFRQ